jgi:hypothetical protein
MYMLRELLSQEEIKHSATCDITLTQTKVDAYAAGKLNTRCLIKAAMHSNNKQHLTHLSRGAQAPKTLYASSQFI